MEEACLLINYKRGVATLRLNRPHVHNAFDDRLVATLIATLEELKSNPFIRVIVLTNNGTSFSAGADLKWMQRMVNYSEAQNLQDSLQLAKLMHTLYNMPQPTIAMINGAVFGGGIGLVACCDIAIAHEHVRFCFSETKLGLIPAVISPYVIKAIGERAARYYFLTAQTFNARIALDMGLISEIVAPEELVETTQHIANTIMRNSPAALEACKELIAYVTQHPLDETLSRNVAQRIAKIRVSPEGQEGLHAFLEKRPAEWVSDNADNDATNS
ncbi:MAG: enoyl-CoA hydratase-related protein [Gammaproteobacteria bacterium]